MILEGAGSASEVNLKKNEIVNMSMARYANASVLLVGNIDHGGIFGSLWGLLKRWQSGSATCLRGSLSIVFAASKSFKMGGRLFSIAIPGKKFLG